MRRGWGGGTASAGAAAGELSFTVSVTAGGCPFPRGSCDTTSGTPTVTFRIPGSPGTAVGRTRGLEVNAWDREALDRKLNWGAPEASCSGGGSGDRGRHSSKSTVGGAL